MKLLLFKINIAKKGCKRWIYVFLVGIVIEEPNFKFIISKNLNFKESMHISLSSFKLKLENETDITIKAYDELADFCYRNFKKGDFIVVSGTINDLFEIEIDFCQMLWHNKYAFKD